MSRPPADDPAPTRVLADPTAPPPADALDFLAPAAEPGEIGRLGRYRVLGVLGSGGMGVVLRAVDPDLDRQLALKVMRPAVAADPQSRARFVREAKAAAAVDHDHVVPIYHVGEAAGVPFLAMPLLRGKSLSAYLAATPRPPVGVAVRVAREVADGLAAAHAKGLVHRDVKPANVWLEDRGGAAGGGPRVRARLLDFGLARAVDGGPADAVTAAGLVVGTPAYRSPEQARGLPVDHRTDLFSLGVMLFEMAAGHRPFRGQATVDVLAAVVADAPRPPADVPPEVARLIHRLLAKDPADRPGSAREVSAELAKIGAAVSRPRPAEPVEAVPAPGSATRTDPVAVAAARPAERSGTRTKSRRKKRRAGGFGWLPWAVAGLALAVAVAALAVAVRPASAPPAAPTTSPPRAEPPAEPWPPPGPDDWPLGPDGRPRPKRGPDGRFYGPDGRELPPPPWEKGPHGPPDDDPDHHRRRK